MTAHTTHRMRDYRQRLREQGLRPIQIWVPDPRSPQFTKRLNTQVGNLHPRDEADVLTHFEGIADWPAR